MTARLSQILHQYLKAQRLFSTTRQNMKRLFEDKDHAAVYETFRPVYPETVAEKIVSYCGKHNGQFESAVDVACGTGQSTRQLSKYYNHVIGTDISLSQISAAHAPDNVKFRVHPAEELSSIPDNSTDLVTTAQAIHWFDVSKFYAEVRRILKPSGGVLAVYGYGMPELDNKNANKHFMDFYHGTLGRKYWDKARQYVETKYEKFTPLPFENFERHDDLFMSSVGNIDSLHGYIITWSGYRSFIKANPGSTELDQCISNIKHVYNASDNTSVNVEITWPIFILMGTK